MYDFIERKPNYYVFLDVDGTLWCEYYLSELVVDAETRKLIELDADDPLAGYENIKLSSESIEAVNTLIRSLKNKFNVKLVITSRRRNNLLKCINYLKVNGLEFDDTIFCIKRGIDPRGIKILDFLNFMGENQKVPKLRKSWLVGLLYKFSKTGFENYVVIDDDEKAIKGFVPPKRFIEVDGIKSSLTKRQVERYLKKNNIQIIESEESSFELK